MVAERNRRLGKLIQRQRSDVQRLSAAVGDRQIEHLIEIAVVNPTVPTDADQIAAHHLIDSASVEVAFEQFHVRIVLAAQFEMRRVARDRHVGQAKQID